MNRTLVNRKRSYRTLMGTPVNSMQRQLIAAYNRRILSARRSGRGRVKVAMRKHSSSVGGLLGGNEADRKHVYRRKRMPARKRRQWRRFVKKVAAVGEKDLGTRTVLINDTITQKNVGTEGQNCLTLALYSMRSATGWLNDMKQIIDLENTGNPTSAAGGTVFKSTKFMFQSGVFDLTFRNTSTFRSTVGGVSAERDDARAAIELDVYEVSHGTTTDDRTANQANLTDCLQYSDDPEIGGAGTDINIYDRGASPFEFGRQMGFFRIKILKKTKYFIPNGQTITHQIRDPSRHSWTKEK